MLTMYTRYADTEILGDPHDAKGGRRVDVCAHQNRYVARRADLVHRRIAESVGEQR